MSIQLHFQQAGGAKALAPLLERLVRKHTFHLSARLAIGDVVSRQFPFLPMASVAAPTTITDDVQLVLTDTINLSRAEGTEACRDMWRAAAQRGVPSVAFVDSWWGYAERFKREGESGYSVLPDIIVVVDEIAEQEIVHAGLPRDRVRVLGSPHFMALAEKNREFLVDAVRRAVGADLNDQVVTFVSQPLENALKDAGDWGFTEREVLALVVDSLNALSADIRKNLVFVLAPHPEESVEVLRAALELLCPKFRYCISPWTDNLELMAATDLVLGMFSILLTEAVVMGRPVMSIQPGLCREDMLITNKTGATFVLRQASDIESALLEFFQAPGMRERLLLKQSSFPFVQDDCAGWEKLLNFFLSE